MGVDLIIQSFNVIEQTKFVLQTLVLLYIADILLKHFHQKNVDEFISLKKEDIYEKYNLIMIKKRINSKFEHSL